MLLKLNLKLDKILQYLLCGFLFLLPWQTIWIYRESFLNGVKWEYGTLGFFATEILLWMIIFLFIFWYWKNFKLQIADCRFKITKDRVFVLSLLSLISYLFISIIWSSDKSLALQQSLRVLEAILLFLIIFIGPFEKEKLAKWFIYGAILPAVLGIWQFLTQTTFASTLLGLANHPVWEAGTSIIQSDTIGRWLRAYGPFTHPNVFGGYLTIVIVVLFSVCHPERRLEAGVEGSLKESVRDSSTSLRFGRNDKISQILLIIIYCLLFTALFFTFSRSAWLAVAIALLFYHFVNPTLPSPCLAARRATRRGKGWGFVILSFIIIFILSIIYFPLLQTRISSQSISEVRSTEERVSGYHEAWQLFKQHSVLGVGAGNYTLALYQQNSNRPGWEYQPAHNVFALFVVEQGIMGILLFVFIILSLISYLLYFKDEIGDRRYAIILILLWLVLTLFDHYLYSSYIGLALGAVFFGLLFKSSAQELPS